MNPNHGVGAIGRRTPGPLEDVSLPSLLERMFESAKDLAAEEAQRVIDEAREERRWLERVAVSLAIGSTLASAALAWLGTTLVLATGAGWVGTLGLAIVGLVGAVGCGLYARSKLPEVVFARTRARIGGRITRVARAATEDVDRVRV